MKTLEQVEPRIDLATVGGDSAAGHRITAPGSYYLSSNVTSAEATSIEIRSSGVTLDLNGFTISRPSGAGAAIRIGQGSDALTDITIKNGHITGPNITSGIFESSTTDPKNVRVTGVAVSNVSDDGINLGTDRSNSVDHCSVRASGDIGIRSGQVSHSTAIECAGIAIEAFGNVSHSRGESAGLHGIDAEGNISDSTGITTMTTTSFASGIFCAANVSNSRGEAVNGRGIYGQNVINSEGVTESGTGIEAARNVLNSTGTTSAVGHGIDSNRNVSNSAGWASAGDNGAGGNGIVADGSVSDSDGRASGDGADGINAGGSVSNSKGTSTSGDGIEADRTISYSFGQTQGTGAAVGLRCSIAIGSSTPRGEAIGNKYFMP